MDGHGQEHHVTAQNRDRQESAGGGNWVATGLAADMADGEMVGVPVEGQNIAIYCVAGQLYATNNVCTHAYALLSDGWLDEEFVECPLHGGRFDVTTGEAQGDPVTCDLKTYPVRVADGLIEVRL